MTNGLDRVSIGESVSKVMFGNEMKMRKVRAPFCLGVATYFRKGAAHVHV